MDRVTLAPYNAQSNGGTDQDSDMQNVNNCTDEDRTDEIDTRISREFPVQCIFKRIVTGKRT